MDKQMAEAIELRRNGNLKQSNKLLLTLVKESPGDAYVNYQCAWSYDVLGKESKAVPFYENAIHFGLEGKDLAGAILGLGSTYRTLGEYEQSKNTFKKGIELFPDNKAIQVFYSMTLYNLGEHSSAMELLLKCLMETTADDEILSYKKAIDFYSSRLDEIWA